MPNGDCTIGAQALARLNEGERRMARIESDIETLQAEQKHLLVDVTKQELTLDTSSKRFVALVQLVGMVLVALISAVATWLSACH